MELVSEREENKSGWREPGTAGRRQPRAGTEPRGAGGTPHTAYKPGGQF